MEVMAKTCVSGKRCATYKWPREHQSTNLPVKVGTKIAQQQISDPRRVFIIVDALCAIFIIS